MFLSFFHFQFIVSLPKINISRILRKRIDDFGQKYRQNSNRKRFVEKGFITRLNADTRYMENRTYKYIASNFPFSLPFLCPVTSGPSFLARKYIPRIDEKDRRIGKNFRNRKRHLKFWRQKYLQILDNLAYVRIFLFIFFPLFLPPSLLPVHRCPRATIK